MNERLSNPLFLPSFRNGVKIAEIGRNFAETQERLQASLFQFILCENALLWFENPGSTPGADKAGDKPEVPYINFDGHMTVHPIETSTETRFSSKIQVLILPPESPSTNPYMAPCCLGFLWLEATMLKKKPHKIIRARSGTVLEGLAFFLEQEHLYFVHLDDHSSFVPRCINQALRQLDGRFFRRSFFLRGILRSSQISACVLPCVSLVLISRL